jgi:hypothetical protein
MLIQEIKDSNNPTVREDSMVEKQQLLKQKSNFIQSEIERNLKEKEYRNEENSRQSEIVGYVKEYKRLERRKTEVILSSQEQKQKLKKDESINRSISEFNQLPTPNRRIPSVYNEPQVQVLPVPTPITPITPKRHLALTPTRVKLP